MEAGKEIHNQALRWALGVLLKKGTSEYESWGSWQRQLTWICGNPWTLNQHLGSLEWIDLGPLNVCDSYVDSSLVRHLAVRSESVCPWHLAGLWEHVSMLDYLIQHWHKRRSMVFPQLDVPCFMKAHGRHVPWRSMGDGENKRRAERENRG